MITININSFRPYNSNDTKLSYEVTTFMNLSYNDRHIIIKTFCKYIANKLRQELYDMINNNPLIELLDKQYQEFLLYNGLKDFTLKKVMQEIISNIDLVDQSIIYRIGVIETSTFTNTKINVYEVYKKIEFGSKYMDAKYFLRPTINKYQNMIYILWHTFWKSILKGDILSEL